MNNLLKLLDLLPKYEEIANLLENEAEASYILRLAASNMACIRKKLDESETSLTAETDEVNYLVQCLADKYWERIHTGHFSEVPLKTRKIYALANYFKIFYLLFESSCQSQAEKCSALLDESMLIGCTQDLYEKSEQLLANLMQYFNEVLISADFELPSIPTLERQQCLCDVSQVDCPSVEVFRRSFFERRHPALLLNTITHWPALSKWRDLNYILKVAGNRTVPIEIGSNYATDEWSQQLVKIRDFLRRQFKQATPDSEREIEYLAQHELFDQIPALKADIRIPDYCTLGAQEVPVDIKAWLGPQGTISPMHYDPKHNLLCQVFGMKKIILAAPTDTPNLYAYESEFLNNTSQIDAAHVDLERYPLVANVRFYKLTLQEGDCLYMPPKWWHYVRSESESFSVSFWWE